MRLVLPSPSTAVFSGGLARVTAQIGMWQVVADEAELEFARIIGSSTGGINAAIAAAYPDQAHERGTEFWTAVSQDRSIRSVWRSTMRSLTNTQSARTRALIEKHLRNALGDLQFDDLVIPLQLTATDLGTGKLRTLESGSVVEALLATVAFPVVVPPVAIEDTLLSDGSMVAGVPVLPARKAGARSLVIFDTGSSVVEESEVETIGWYQVMALAATHMLRGQAEHDVNLVARDVPVIVIDCAAGNPFDLKAAPSLISVGATAAEQTLKGMARHPDQKRMTITKPGVYGNTDLRRSP